MTHCNAKEYGKAALILGAGRETKADEIDHSAGIVLEKRRGDKVNKGDVIAYLHTNREKAVEEAEKIILSSTHIEKEPPSAVPLIHGIVM